MIAVQVKLENAGNHDDGLGPIPRFVQRVTQRRNAIDEQTSAPMRSVLDDPLTPAILAKEEPRNSA